MRYNSVVMEKSKSKLRHIPNILSGLRVLMVGAFIWCFVRELYWCSLGVYALAFFTDLLDGYLARRNNWISDLGKVLDPFADKLMLITALTCFMGRGWMPVWMYCVAVGKELIMIIGGLLLLGRRVVVFADWFGKIAAGFFNAGVAATLLKHFWPWIGYWNLVLLAMAILLAIIALIHYARKQVFVKREPENKTEE